MTYSLVPQPHLYLRRAPFRTSFPLQLFFHIGSSQTLNSRGMMDSCASSTFCDHRGILKRRLLSQDIDKILDQSLRSAYQQRWSERRDAGLMLSPNRVVMSQRGTVRIGRYHLLRLGLTNRAGGSGRVYGKSQPQQANVQRRILPGFMEELAFKPPAPPPELVWSEVEGPVSSSSNEFCDKILLHQTDLQI